MGDAVSSRTSHLLIRTCFSQRSPHMGHFFAAVSCADGGGIQASIPAEARVASGKPPGN